MEDMKDIFFRLLLTSCLFSLSNSAFSQEWIPLSGDAKGEAVTMKVQENDELSYKVHISVNGLYDNIINNEYGLFHSISFGSNGHLAKEGEPALPLITRLIAIPSGTTPMVSIKDEVWEEISIGTLFPTQKSFYDGFHNAEFSFCDSVYERPFLPPVLQCSKEMIWRGIRNFRIQMCPFKYYPQLNSLLVLKEFVLSINFQGQAANLNSQKSLHKDYSHLGVFDNSVFSDQSLSTKVSQTTNENYDYLIIASDNTILNSEEMKEFRRWKALMGYKSKTMRINPINNNPSNIKDSITAEYNNGIKYVLLVGDINDIPAKEITYGSNSFISDYWYGCIEGNDVEQEVAIGRFPVSSLEQFSHMMDKTIRYETWKNLDYESLLVAHNEFGGYYLFERCCDSIVSKHHTKLPFITAYGSNSSSTNSYVTNIINQGAHIVNYRGHAAVNYWGPWNNYSESYYSTVIDTIQQNTNAVFFSVACNTGNLNADNCMLRAFMCPSNGAAAFLGSSTESEHGTNNEYNKSLYGNLLDSMAYCLGDLNMKAFMDLMKGDLYLPNIEENAYSYICGGDPSLELWTATPQTMNVDWSVGNGQVTINTNLTGDYYITVASENGNLLEKDTCSNSSTYTVPIPSNHDKFYIAVNKHNYYPYIIFFDTISEEIIDKTFDYDAYYSASPVEIFSMPPTFNEEVVVKSGHKLSIKNGSEGVNILENFECEKGARFEIK